MKILVTGASGFVGSYFCKQLCENHKVVALVKNKNSYSNLNYYKLEQKIDIVEADLSSTITSDLMQNNCILRYDFDIVLHFAAQAIVKKSHERPVETFQSNIIGTANLIEYFKSQTLSNYGNKLKLFLNMSTDKVYGNKVNAKEEDIYEVSCPYSASKIAVEQICRSYVNSYNIPILMVRPCNIYGEGDFNKRVIPNVIESILQKNEAVLFEGDDKMFRQYIYIEDLFNAIMYLVEKSIGGKLKNISVFNISPNQISKLKHDDCGTLQGVSSTEKIVKTLSKISGRDVKLITKPSKSYVEIPAQSVNANELSKVGFTTSYDLTRGLEKTFKWFQANPDYFDKMIKR